MDAGAIFSANWQVVRTAPAAFFIVVAIVAGAIRVALNWKYKVRLGR